MCIFKYLILMVSIGALNLFTNQTEHSKKDLVSFYRLKEVLNSKQHQDTIFIKNGIYNNIQLTLKNHKPVVIIAETPGKVILVDTTQINLQSCKNMTLSGLHFDSTISSQLIKLDYSKECVIENSLFKNNMGTSPYSKIIGLQNSSSDNIIRNNTFDNLEVMGVTIREEGSVYNKVYNNFFKNTTAVNDIYPNTDGNGMESIQVGAGGNDEVVYKLHTTIKNNVFENIIGDKSEVISVKSSNNSIIGNEFYKCIGGITLRFGSDNTVSSNYFEDTDQPIRLFGPNHIVNENYIENAIVGIHLPSANYIQKNKELKLGYSQSNNINITGNAIINSKKADIQIGSYYSNNRSKLPNNIKITDNYITKEKINIIEYPPGINKSIYLKANNQINHSFSEKIKVEYLKSGIQWKDLN